MNIVKSLLFIGLIYSASGSFLSDIFTGLDEAVKDIDVTKVKEVGAGFVKSGKEVAKEILDSIPEVDWVEETKKFLHGIKFNDVLEQKSNMTMDEIVTKWNGLLKDLNNKAKFKDNSEMYEKVMSDMKALFPKPLFKKWKKEVHSVMKKIKKVIKSFDIKDLKSAVKTWEQPSFMKRKESIAEDKEILKEAVEAANEKIKEGSEHIMPLIKLSEDENEEDESEEELKEWIKKTFKKPHHKSGKKWFKIIDSLKKGKIPKKVSELPESVQKKIKNVMKKAKANLVVVKEPAKVSVVEGKDIPLKLLEEIDDAKDELKTPTPKQVAEYEVEEKKWEAKVLSEVKLLANRLHDKKIVVKPEPTKAAVTKAPVKSKSLKEMMTGNENWELLDKNPWDEEEDEIEDESEDSIQNVRAQLNNDKFTHQLADREVEWFNLKKELKKFGV